MSYTTISDRSQNFTHESITQQSLYFMCGNILCLDIKLLSLIFQVCLPNDL